MKLRYGIIVALLLGCTVFAEKEAKQQVVERTRPAEWDNLVPGGQFARLYGTGRIEVNTLHGQGVLSAGDRIVVEGVAEDSTIEAISIDDAPGFALGVQWHAEHDPSTQTVNAPLWRAFSAAMSGNN